MRHNEVGQRNHNDNRIIGSHGRLPESFDIRGIRLSLSGTELESMFRPPNVLEILGFFEKISSEAKKQAWFGLFNELK